MKNTRIGSFTALMLLILAAYIGAPISATEITIGTGTSSASIPLLTHSADARLQSIYLAGEIGGAYRFSCLALNVTTISGQTMRDFTIRMKHTSLSSYTTPIWESSDWVTVYQEDEAISSAGWHTFVFSTPFDYNGIDNLMVDVSFNNDSGTTDGKCTYTTVTGVRSVYYSTSTDYGNPLGWSGSTPSALTANKIVNVKLGDQIVTTPIFSPGAGTYESDVDVTVTCATPGAAIHYTTNGLDPTESDPSVVSGTVVQVHPPMTLKARAYLSGMLPSDVRAVLYDIPTVAVPTLNPEGGTYTAVVNVTVESSTPGSVIHYTTDGVDPTESDPVIASGSIMVVDHTLTLKAGAWMTGFHPSALATASYTLNLSRASTPTFSPGAGTYTGVQQVIVTCATSDARIHYSTNGVDPTENDPIVVSGSAVLVERSLTLRARAWKYGYNPSSTRSADYTINAPTVATPVFSPAASMYTVPQNVVITCATAEAVIHYTTSGLDPTESDPILASGSTVLVDRTLTLKAKAWRTGLVSSNVKTGVYDILVSAPLFNPGGGTYYGPQNVVANCATAQATIHYTTSGVDPTESDPIIAAGTTIPVDHTVTLKAKAWKDGWTPSAVNTFSYNIIVATPAFSPSTGTYYAPQTVVITCATQGVAIHYSTNGADPTESDPVAESGSAVLVDHTLTLKARAWKAEFAPSGIRSATYTLKTVTPTFSPAAGTYLVAQDVMISCSTPDAVIHYTTNGSTPTQSDPIIASGSTVRVDVTLTLKANAWRTGWTTSSTATATYAINPTANPTFSPSGGTYYASQNVMIACATEGATIHYTTNGIDPTESDPVIASGSTLLVDRPLTLRARAWKPGFSPSSTVYAVYYFTAATPTFSPAAATYNVEQTVTVGCTTPDAVIHYTTNGVTPTESDPIIASGSTVPVDRTLTLRARAWRTGWTMSSTKTGYYYLTPVTPTISPTAGTYYSEQNVTVSCTTPDAVIHYTTNGVTPTESDTVIGSGSTVLVDHTLTLKAKAWKTGWTASLLVTAQYIIKELTVSVAKSMANGVEITTYGRAVSAVFGDLFYIEGDDRSCGIRVEKANHGLSVGMRVDVSGTLRTSPDGERYIEATSALENGAGIIEPIILANRDIGGADWRYDPVTGAGQMGLRESRKVFTDPPSTQVFDMVCLNNIGLLACTTGHVTHSESGFFYIDDGSALDDGSGHKGIRVAGEVPVGEGEDPVGRYVSVTGISSCYKAENDHFRLIRATEITIVPE